MNQEKEKPSTLVQGGLEMIIKMKATWESQEKLTILSAKVAEKLLIPSTLTTFK